MSRFYSNRFGDYRPAPAARQGSYRRKYGTSWWGQQFLEALEQADNSGRLGRGKTYANKGLVLNMEETAPGQLSATVQGSRRQPYRISMRWKAWSSKRSKALCADIMANPALIGQLLAGKLPESLLDISKAHGLTIFPEAFGELGLDCNCPDWSLPCKHQAALLYVIAAEIDADPFRLFAMRGLDLKTVIAETAGEKTADELEILRIGQLIGPIQEVGEYSWDEAAASQLDLGQLRDDGYRSLTKLPGEPAFDGDGDLQKFLADLYLKTKRLAPKMWRESTTLSAREMLPPGTWLELHLNKDLGLDALLQFDEEDQLLKEITDETALLDWLMDLEGIDRQWLDPEARTLVLAFQIARKLAETKGYIPEILTLEEEQYLLRYVPATNRPETGGLLKEAYALTSPALLFYKHGEEELFQVLIERAGEQLISSLLGMFIRRATPMLQAAGPARELFLLRGSRAFSLTGTEGFPAAIHRWLARLHLAKSRWRIVFQVNESADNLLTVDLLIEDARIEKKKEVNEAAAPILTAPLPLPLKSWLTDPEITVPDRMSMFRTLGGLTEHFPDLEGYLADGAANPLVYTTPAFTMVLMDALPTMEILGLTILLPTPLKKLLLPSIGLRADVGTREVMGDSGLISLDNLLCFSWQLAIGNRSLSEAEFRELLTVNEGLVKFKEGYAYLAAGEVAKLLVQLDTGPPKLKPYEKMQALFTEEFAGGPVFVSTELRNQIKVWRNGPPAALPTKLEAKLRPYQETGFQWLYANSSFGFGSIIADDMGLGKTLQVIALLEKFREEGALKRQKAIVVVPTSLLGNWRREINRFAPHLREYIYYGSDRRLPSNADYDVLLTTYGILRSETSTFSGQNWGVLVIDEAQAIKNPSAKQTKAIKKIKAPVRIAMSGTPVENRLLDYWSLLDFTLPGFLGSRKWFSTSFGRPITADRDQQVAERFRRLTAPFVLRRLKTDKSIISDLPEKVVQTEYAALLPDQAALYQSILDENMRLVEETETGIGRQGLILKLITGLKQCCNHPAQFLKRGPADFAASGKALLLRERLESILANGDKTLIFTQYREMGNLLVTMIRDHFGLEIPFLHGGSSLKDREAMVARFQNDPACPIFLLSIKAGGTGLNLTAANHVIHYDLWWNPAVEAQATDRAFRIGQEKTVFVHRLVTENTFEDKIDQLIHHKKALAELSVGTGETFVGKMSNQALKDIVALG